MNKGGKRPWAIYYEHPHWFKPFFEELDRRGRDYLALRPEDVSFDVRSRDIPFQFLFNRMSPSAYLRGRQQAIFFTQNYLEFLEARHVPVLNGARAFRLEVSKVLQLELLSELGISFPPTVVLHHRSQVSAARNLRFPVVSKPNQGGSGAGIRRFESFSQLEVAAARGEIDPGGDGTTLIQEYIPPAEGRVTRVETLGGRLLYAIHVHPNPGAFNLCPADLCATTDGRKLARQAVAENTPEPEAKVAHYRPPAEVVEDVVRIVTAAGIDVGGIEYVEDARNGRRYYYDINALSNFVADAVNVIGFDPVARLVDHLDNLHQAYSAA